MTAHTICFMNNHPSANIHRLEGSGKLQSIRETICHSVQSALPHHKITERQKDKDTLEEQASEAAWVNITKWT